MIGIILPDKKHEYGVVNLIKVFFPKKEVKVVLAEDEVEITIKLLVDNELCSGYIFESGIKKVEIFNKNDMKQYNLMDENSSDYICVKYTLFKLLEKYTGKQIEWGILTGIRPTKIVSKFYKKGLTSYEIKKILKNNYGIAENKIDLMLSIAKIEKQVLSSDKENDISIYIGIPFCPTKCLYCSFTSYSIEKYEDYVDMYLEALEKEIIYVGSKVKNNRVRSIYIGGGTPTSINEMQIERLMKAINKNIDMKKLEEFTVEAGRPDTITTQKLVILKKYNVSRISINPQTMNQNTLDLIGRKHSIEEVKDKYKMAREIGFDNINMDLIVGLPGEKLKDVQNTMYEIKKLRPESITVHTMAIKRASRLKIEEDKYKYVSDTEIKEMIELAYTEAKEIGLSPYYMYRQKNMVGSFENVGYALPGKESIYNIEIIEENQSIIAIGAGAITKLFYKGENKLERIENVKDVKQYVERIDEMINRKKVMLDKELLNE